MTYVDGFVIVVPTANSSNSRTINTGETFHGTAALPAPSSNSGATSGPDGKADRFPPRRNHRQMRNETVLFSLVECPTRRPRDEAMADGIVD